MCVSDGKKKRCGSVKYATHHEKQAMTKDHVACLGIQNKPRNTNQRLTAATSLTNGLDNRYNEIYSMQFAIMASSYFLSYLSYKIKLMRRSFLEWSGVCNGIQRFYQGLILICAVSVLEAQNSSVLSSSIIGPSNATVTISSTSVSNNSITLFTQTMTTSLHATPTSIMHSVNTSVDPSPTQTQSTNLTLSSDVSFVANMTSIYDVITSSSVNTIMPSNVETSNVTSLMNWTSSSAYHVNGTSVIDMLSSASSNVSSSTAMIQENQSTTIRVIASTVINSSTPVMANSTVTDIGRVNMTSSSVVLTTFATPHISPATSIVNETMSTATPVNLTSSVIPTAIMQNLNSTTIFVNATSSGTVQMNATTPSSAMLSRVSTSYANASSVTAKINETTPTSTMLSPVSTSYINASSVQMNVTTPSTSIFSSVTSSERNVNATMTSTLVPSSSIVNGSSVMTILPSTPWPSSTNHSSTYSTMSSNISVSSSSVNHTSQPITPNSTMMVMNSSSSALPTPAPVPNQDFVSFGINVTIVNKKFTPDLNDKNSSAYKDLELKAKNTFETIFAPLPGFVSVEILDLRQGSVVVDMKVTFNTSTNVTTTKIKDTIISNNASKNTQNFIFSQALSVKGDCSPSFCVNGGTCKTNITVGAFCTCPSGFNGVRCDKVIVNGGYSSWSSFSECSKSCKGGKMHRKRTCTNPPPQNGGRDCSGLGPDYEEKDCNSDVLCPVIWIIIGVCCAVFLILLILLIICCLKRKRKEKQQSSAAAGSQMNIVPLEIMVCDFDLPTARRRSPDGISNPEFVNESETEEDDIYKKQLLLFLKQSHLIKPGMNLSFGDDISDTSDYSNTNSRKASAVSTEHDETQQYEKPRMTSEL